ncbi:MAG: polysaccharide biosynthesis tyrosine autokinase [Flavobacteriaceae bacterium]|jgi:capsular exopolysaccharide synthesis family protein|nr:polysaccharide biosynthesis tyrosine autokinase [Flavobacteriaceae bacterium]
MQNNNINTKGIENEQEINLKQLLEQYMSYWKIFVLSIIACIGLAIIYLQYAEKMYAVSAKILLQDDSQGASGELAGLSELASLAGGSSTSAFVADQIDVVKSRRILQKVVKNNGLNIKYYVQETFKKNEILASDLPFTLTIIENNTVDRPNNYQYNFTFELKDHKSFSIEDENGLQSDLSFGQKINTALGVLTFMPKNVQKVKKQIYNIQYNTVDKTIDALLKVISIEPNKEKQSFIVNFSMQSPLRAKAEMILNSLIQEYNNDVTLDKGKITKATSDFITARLELVSKDLSSADSDVAVFKDHNSIIDMQSEANLFMKTATDNEIKLLDYETQLSLAKFMSESVKQNKIELLPSNIGLNDNSIEETISNYNKLVLEREDLLRSAKENNPVIININNNLNDLKRNLDKSLDNYRKGLQMNVNTLQSQKNALQVKLNKIPSKEKGFKNIARQQQIVESLYLFLLQKREETEIKAAATPANMKVIDAAYGSDLPVAPKKSIILLASLILGFLIPFTSLYLKFLLDNKIHSKKEIESILGTPVISEIPVSEDPIIKENDRSSLAEAFRILRTNISFMLGAKQNNAIIYVTSTTKGEGKSFVSTNLSRILTASNKRVLLIGADIRSPKILEYLNITHYQHTNIGITQYLLNPDMDIENIIIKKPDNYQFDIIYSGFIAPNPGDLLVNGHFKDIIEYGRAHYDYVVVDTAPVALVTDTLLISEHADITLYVTRANYLDRRMLDIPKELYKEKRLKNMAVILNGVDFTKGYGYGYGYGYGEVESKTTFEKIKEKFKL